MTAPTPGTDRLAAADEAIRRRPHDATRLSHRNAYHPPMPRGWFLATREYRAYAVREFVAVIVGLFVLNLMLGLVVLASGPQGWEWWVALQRNPAVMVLNALALVAAVIHTVSWDQLTPSIIKVQRGTRFLADGWIIGQQALLLVAFALVVALWLSGVIW